MTCDDCRWKKERNECPWDYQYENTDYAEDCDDFRCISSPEDAFQFPAVNRKARYYRKLERMGKSMKRMKRRQKLINWPPLEEVEHLRWTNNHTQYRSITYGFCEAQDCCEICDSKMRMLCKIKCWIDGLRLRIIKRHYGIKNGW